MCTDAPNIGKPSELVTKPVTLPRSIAVDTPSSEDSGLVKMIDPYIVDAALHTFVELSFWGIENIMLKIIRNSILSLSHVSICNTISKVC